MEKLLDEIESYWSTRTEGYSEVNHKELAGTQKNAWLKVLTSQFPDKPKEEIRILDIGTGPGFFPVILAEAGYHVDAVDYTEGMLEKAKENGVTKEEIVEVITQLAFYTGWPKGWAVFALTMEVYKEN